MPVPPGQLFAAPERGYRAERLYALCESTSVEEDASASEALTDTCEVG
jgi:hypothetical protein